MIEEEEAMNKVSAILVTLFMLAGVCFSAFAEMLEVGAEVAGFRLISVDEISTIQSTLFTWRHEKTGALLCHVANDDTNRAFTIAFHTPVSEDTGLPHVFEHAALGGSKKYPDPNLVFSMMYGTYSTHMNAYTSTTYTAFQTASLSEEQLLSNMDVYLDGVFNPALLSDPHAMMRDAYRYQLSDSEGELSLQGVVYSEMLGALSHTRIANLRLYRLLWPGSVVGSLSGGMPDEIPKMTWQDLCAFHARYYTPGNSLTVLYGDIEIGRFLAMINDSYFSHYEEEHPSLADHGYRSAEGTITANFTYPAPADTQPETILLYAIPVGFLNAEKAELLHMGLNLMTRPDHLLEKRMTAELNRATWSLGMQITKAGSAIIFRAEGLDETDAPKFREIIEDALENTAEKGFSEEDLRMYADSQRYENALARETLNGVNLGSSLAAYWDLFSDPRSILPVYDLGSRLEELVTDGRCAAALRSAVESSEASVLLISTTEPGGSERVLEERASSLLEKKQAMTADEIQDLVASTEEYNTWAEKSQAASMLSDVTAVTVATLPEEVEEAEATQRKENGLTVVFSELPETEYLSAEWMLDISKVPQEDLLPLRVAALFLGSLETEKRDRLTLERDLNRAAHGLMFSLRTLENDSTGEWRPVFSVSWETFSDLIDESVSLISEVLEQTRLTDLSYIRSMLTSDALTRRRNYTVSSPHTLTLLEARRETDEPTAWALLSGGIRLIEYEEALAAMDDSDLVEALTHITEVLGRSLSRENAILTVAGGKEACRQLAAKVENTMREWPEQIEAERIPIPSEGKKNVRILVDSNVNYNLEYMTAEETGLEYTAGLSAFANVISDQVLMPVFRYQNSVYSVFFQISRDEAFILTYRDPNFGKSFTELFPFLGSLAREALADLTEEELAGYVSGVYSGVAMPIGPIARANLAISGLMRGRDFFLETREAMRDLKNLKTEDLIPWTDLLDKLSLSGLKVTVTSPGNANELTDLFPIVNTDFLK